ncbi:MAG: amidase [Proteobacteria bacterium]|nr:amidase [Pseudomonadota bacterium]
MDFRQTNIAELVRKIRRRDISAVEVTSAALENIEKVDGQLNSFCLVNPERALAEASAVDSALARGEDLLLAGVPIGVKDLEDAAGYVTTFGSDLHTGDPEADQDSELVRRLKAAGCVVIGKTNTPEFGHRGKTDNVPFGITRNPWNLDHTPGGSSGGSAAALAAGIVPLATGSDGGGSIRIPSALCGLSGIKTSQGRIPNGGKLPPGSGLLTVKGPMARTTLETALALDLTVGDLATDIFAQVDKADGWLEGVQRSSLPDSIVWSPTMGFATVDKEIMAHSEAAISKLAAAGVTIIENDDIWETDPVRDWLVFWTSARARAQQHLIGTQDWERIDPQLRKMIEMGTKTMGTAYALAIDAGHHLNYKLEQAFTAAPLIVTPAVCGHTPTVENEGVVNGQETPGWVGFTVGLNMTRNPAGVVPIGKSNAGLPLALQVIGRQRADLSVLQAMHRFEQVFEFTEVAGVGVVD